MPDEASDQTIEDIKNRIQPILNKVAVDGLRAWLKTIEFTVPASVTSRATITELIIKLVAEGQLAEAALEEALIGFEEASDMRIYLFRLEGEVARAKNSLTPRLQQFGVPVTNERMFAGSRANPMSPVYARIEGNLFRMKWAEEQDFVKINPHASGVITKTLPKRAILIADYSAATAELRLNPPENSHSYTDVSGRPTADAYYSAYLAKAKTILGCESVPLELRPVIKSLVEQEDPRIIRIHIDNHTDQKNYRNRTSGPRVDVRDSPDWQLAYKENGSTWAWDAQSFYWLPKVSGGSLKREVFTHIDAEEGFVKVNADCSNDEVEYVVSQIRAR